MTFLLSFLDFGKMAAQAVFAWLSKRSLAEVVCIALSLALALDHLALLMSHRHAHKVETQLTRAIASRDADRTAYVKAQAAAAVQNKAQVAKVEQQSKKVSDDERQAYLSDLAQLRAARLRQQNAAPQRAPGSPGAPSAPGPASGTNADGLQVPPSADVREDAAEIELRLLHLQRWVEQQLTIDPNK